MPATTCGSRIGPHAPAQRNAIDLEAAPPVLEFDADGTLLSSWGGPGAGYEWPQLEHGIHVDHRDRVWLGPGGEKDAQILAFTREGKFLMQIGHQGKGRGSNDTDNLGAPAHMVIDREANELYVADGYVNHRVIVFDADTGKYKRHWGAYGKRPDDGFFTRAGKSCRARSAARCRTRTNPANTIPTAPPAPQFRIVHAVRIAHDGLVYVCDRTNDRMQVFRKDGTFVQEVVIAKETFGSGSVWDIGFSHRSRAEVSLRQRRDQSTVYILDRQTLRGGQAVRPRRPLGGPVLRRAQSCRQFEGRPLHHRNLRRQARAEVPVCRSALDVARGFQPRGRGPRAALRRKPSSAAATAAWPDSFRCESSGKYTLTPLRSRFVSASVMSRN